MNNALLVGLGVVLGLWIAKRRCGCHSTGGVQTALPPAPTGGLDDGTSGATLGYGSGSSSSTGGPIDLGGQSGSAGCTGCGRGYATAGGATMGGRLATTFGGGVSL
jgi:hypothetical protein